MSRAFVGFGQAPYIGVPVVRSHDLFGGGKNLGRAIQATLNWISYGAATAKPNVNVLFDWSRLTLLNLPTDWKCRSIYIDNTGSPVPVYVYFPDTNWTVAAAPFSTVVFPALTNDTKAWIVGEGFTDGNIPSTLVYFVEANLAPYSDLELPQTISLYKASPLITRGTGLQNQNYGPPALGDQMICVSMEMSASANPQTVFNFGTGFIYITSISLLLNSSFNNPGVTTTLFFESTGASGLLFKSTFLALPPAFGTSAANFPLLQLSGMNVKINGSELWQLRRDANNQSGYAVLTMSYTLNPLSP